MLNCHDRSVREVIPVYLGAQRDAYAVEFNVEIFNMEKGRHQLIGEADVLLYSDPFDESPVCLSEACHSSGKVKANAFALRDLRQRGKLMVVEYKSYADWSTKMTALEQLYKLGRCLNLPAENLVAIFGNDEDDSFEVFEYDVLCRKLNAERKYRRITRTASGEDVSFTPESSPA
ncbi:MAG TPA: hypothetical protein ENN60_03125 [archaeon]|nr:hypothetical protein [archaeon]